MKKFFTLCLGLVAALSIQAQSDFPAQFADKDGNIIPDGTVLNLNESEDDGFGSIMVPTNLYVKNVSDAELQIGGSYTIVSMSNGAFQTCFPMNCVQKNEVGSYQTESGPLAIGELKNMMTEWLPTAEGTAEVTYQLYTFKQNAITKKWNKDKPGPTVTLKFSFGVTAIAANELTASADTNYFDLQGRRVTKPSKGIFINNGKKIVVR